MKNIILAVTRFIKDEEGVTAIEYGLLASLIAVVLIAGAFALGNSLNCLFNALATCVGSAPNATTCSTAVQAC